MAGRVWVGEMKITIDGQHIVGDKLLKILQLVDKTKDKPWTKSANRPTFEVHQRKFFAACREVIK